MTEPRRIWWARPRKLCALERPGGGGRSHRPERREAEIAWLKEHGVRTVVSTMATRHNLPAYEAAGLDVPPPAPVPSTADGAAALEELLPLLRRELRRARGGRGARQPPHRLRGGAVRRPPARGARDSTPRRAWPRARDAGLMVTPEACALLGVDYEAVQPRSRMAASTSSGRSVTT